MIRKMTKEEAIAHMVEMMKRLPSNELEMHREAISKVLESRETPEMKAQVLMATVSTKVLQ